MNVVTVKSICISSTFLITCLFSFIDLFCALGKPNKGKCGRPGARAESNHHCSNQSNNYGSNQSNNHCSDQALFPIKSKTTKRVSFSEEIGDRADSKSKRKSSKVPCEEHFDDCGSDDTP